MIAFLKYLQVHEISTDVTAAGKFVHELITQ